MVDAALLVRDDLCVLARTEGTWRLVAAVVCFPSRWRLADKMGRDVLAIHDPVPGYRSGLGAPTTKVFDALTPRWRLNWTLLDDPALFQPAAPAGGHQPGPDSYLRVERQCLVPVGDVVAFTIRTDVVALADLPNDRAKAVGADAFSQTDRKDEAGIAHADEHRAVRGVLDDVEVAGQAAQPGGRRSALLKDRGEPLDVSAPADREHADHGEVRERQEQRGRCP